MPDDSGEPYEPEMPSTAAYLEIFPEPMKDWPGGGSCAEARYVIAAFAIMGTVAATTVGVVLLAPSAPLLALLEVVLGLAAIVLIAVGGHRHEL